MNSGGDKRSGKSEKIHVKIEKFHRIFNLQDITWLGGILNQQKRISLFQQFSFSTGLIFKTTSKWQECTYSRQKDKLPKIIVDFIDQQDKK